MTQFASKLYPQTNPSNQALLDLRELHAVSSDNLWGTACTFAHSLVSEGPGRYGEPQWRHAREVLSKILSHSDPGAPTG